MAKKHILKNIILQVDKISKSICQKTRTFAAGSIAKIPAKQKQKFRKVCFGILKNFEIHLKYDISKIQNGDFNYCKAKFFGALIGVIFFAMPGLFIGLIVGHFLDLSQKSDNFKTFVEKNKKTVPVKESTSDK